MAAAVGGIRCCCYSTSRSAPIPLCWCLMPLTSTSAPNFNLDVSFASRGKAARPSRLYFGADLSGSDRNSPLLAPRCFSQHDDDCEFLSEGPISVTGGIVALGKFDALHIGHRQLAIQASKAGIPFLLSFVGMAEVLGWEARPPVVAKCDRKRVLSTWASYCGNISPGEFHVQFSSVRHLSPREFVEKLANELKVSGVVTGENYRFGYKAAGDASELVKLCEEYGMKAYIVGSVMDNKAHGSLLDSKDKGQVSSTRVRRALADGDINYVTELLGRNHRLVLTVSEEASSGSGRISVPKSCLLNLPPEEGSYDKCCCFIGDSQDGLPCTALIDSTHIHVESTIQNISFEHCQLIGIEFGCDC